MAPTAGFQVPTMPMAPMVPSNIGIFDPSQPQKNAALAQQVAQQLANANRLREAEAAQLEQQRAKAEFEKATTGVQSNILQQTAPSITKTAVLQAGGAATEAQRVHDLREQARSTNAVAGFLADLDVARKAPGAGDRAAQMASLKTKYGWLGSVPEYASLPDTLEKERAAAEQQALEEQKAKAALDVANAAGASRERVAGTLAGSREKAAETAAGSRVAVANIPRTGVAAQVYHVGQLHDQLAQQIMALDENPDDPQILANVDSLKKQIDAANLALNKVSATAPSQPATPAGQIDVERIKNLEAEATKADAEGNAQLAAALRDHIKALNSKGVAKKSALADLANFGAKPGAAAAPVAAGGPAAPHAFKTPAEADAAFKAGTLKIGDRITVGGQPGTWK